MKLKLFIIMVVAIVLIQGVSAVPMAPLPNSNFTTYMNFDSANMTYLKYVFGNMQMTGNITSPVDMSYGLYKPFGDAMVNMTGIEESWFWPVLIVWMLLLLTLVLSTGNTNMSLIVAVGSASFFARFIPNVFFSVITALLAFCIVALMYKIFVDR